MQRSSNPAGSSTGWASPRERWRRPGGRSSSTSPRIFIIWWDVFFFKTRQTRVLYLCEVFFFELFGWSFFLSLKKHPKFRKNGSNVSNLSRFDDYTPQKLTWNRKKMDGFQKESPIQECNFQVPSSILGGYHGITTTFYRKISQIPTCSKPGGRCCNGIPTYQFKYRLVQNTPWKINMEHNHRGLQDHFPF